MLDRVTASTGLSVTDLAILIGALALIFGLLLLGLSGNGRGRRWLFWLGSLATVGGLGLLAYGARRYGAAPTPGSP